MATAMDSRVAKFYRFFVGEKRHTHRIRDIEEISKRKIKIEQLFTHLYAMRIWCVESEN
jgi:hypothetical protein